MIKSSRIVFTSTSLHSKLNNQIDHPYFPVLKQSPIELNQKYTLPGEEIQEGDRFIIRGTHTSDTEQWAINLWDKSVRYTTVFTADINRNEILSSFICFSTIFPIVEHLCLPSLGFRERTLDYTSTVDQHRT